MEQIPKVEAEDVIENVELKEDEDNKEELNEVKEEELKKEEDEVVKKKKKRNTNSNQHIVRCCYCLKSLNRNLMSRVSSVPTMRVEWVRSLGTSFAIRASNIKNPYICRAHFNLECFTRSGFLKRNSIPTPDFTVSKRVKEYPSDLPCTTKADVDIQ